MKTSTTSTAQTADSKSLSNIRFITITALFIALTYVFTAFINIRLPITANGGLIHLGNVPLFICAIIFGKKSGAIAGGVGMGLFDLLSGWTAWAPFTLIIVGLMGYAVGAITEKHHGFGWNTLAIAVACVIKVAGYYIAEGIIYGNWIGGCLMASLFVVLAYSVCRCQSEQKQMILTIEMDSLVLTEGDEAEIRLRIHGITSKINSYTFRLEYEMTSKFRKQRMRKKKNIVWNPQEGDSITLSEMITECDSYHIQICSVSWEDLTGMYKVKKEFNKQISFLVMPKRYEMGFMQEKIARRDLMEQGFEYDGVRKYQEGDRISRVHWNLYAATGGLWVRKNEEEEEERVKIGLSLDDIEKDRISDYMAAFYSISFFLKSQGVIQEIYYGEHKYLLCHIEQYEELFTDIFCGKYELSSDPMEHLYKIPLCEKGQDLQKFLYDMEL